jgi:arylsulfatase A-like enzyme
MRRIVDESCKLIRRSGRPVLAVSLFLGFACLQQFAPSLLAADPVRRTPPNVVLIISDDQGWTDFGFMHHPAVKTPHLDGLAARSAVFRRGYVPTSLCRPSLATIITGLYPHQHKISGNDPPAGSDRSVMLKHIRAAPSLPRLLAERGYRSFQSGKWWEGSYAEGGFTAGMTHGDPRRGGRHGDLGLRIGREGLQPVFDFIDSCGNTPYFLWYAPMMPHEPHDPPARILAKYQRADRPAPVARYFAMCEWFDETCGQLLDFIEHKGQLDNTLVIFLVDNGWAPPEPGQHQKDERLARFSPKSKLSPYDGGIRTPVLVSWPGTIRPADYATLVSSIDVAPTVLAAAGLSKTPAMPGLNLLDVIAAGGRSERAAVFGAIFDHDVVDVDDPAKGLRFRWCVDGPWKIIVPADRRQSPELYDVLADPFEQTSRAADRPDLVKRLSAELDAWWPLPRDASSTRAPE